ncbi:hypothetical protein [Verminephrobacter eiseniae]|uniref:hypothetical protein n=1 Tax=Verminephrobacter eiseniae TaxID=364317 RepID=UPI002237D1C0|nr:hypothetical protein [Verminephrobacter eiseniae]
MSAPALTASDRMADQARRFESASRSPGGLAQNRATDSTTRHALSGSSAMRWPAWITAPSIATLPCTRCPLGAIHPAMDTAKPASVSVSLLDSAGRQACMGGSFSKAISAPYSGALARR